MGVRRGAQKALGTHDGGVGGWRRRQGLDCEGPCVPPVPWLKGVDEGLSGQRMA